MMTRLINKLFLENSSCHLRRFEQMLLCFSLAVFYLSFICLQNKAFAQTPVLSNQTKNAESLGESKVNSAQKLEVGQSIKRELAGGQAHNYSVPLKIGEFIEIAVERKGIDVVVSIFDEKNNLLSMSDSVMGRRGVETVLSVANSSADYRVEVKSFEKEAASGSYEIKTVNLRLATETDRQRSIADQICLEAEHLQKEKKPEFFKQAIKKYQESLEMQRRFQDHAREGAVLTKIGIVYAQLNEWQRSLGYRQQALKAYQNKGDNYNAAWALNDIAQSYYYLYDFQKAFDHLEQALTLLQTYGEPYDEASLFVNIGALYSKLGERYRAIEYLQKALLIFKSAGNGYDEAVTLNNIGNCYIAIGQPDVALKFLEQALQLTKTLEDQSREALVLNSIGLIYRKFLNKPLEAFKYHQQALAISRTISDQLTESKTLSLISDVYVALNDQQLAFNFANNALVLARINGNSGLEADLLCQLAEIEKRRGNLAQARSDIETALSLIEIIRARVNTADWRASYLSTVQKYYDLNIDVLMQLHYRQPTSSFAALALQASERARARSLLEILHDSRTNLDQNIDLTLLKQLQQIQLQLSALAARKEFPDKKLSTADQQKLEEQISVLSDQAQQLQTKIKTSNSKYAALAQSEPITLEQIQRQLLDKDTTLLEYSLGEEQSFLWVVTVDSIETYQLPKRADIEKDAKHVYQLLIERNRFPEGETPAQRFERLQRTETEYAQTITNLSQMLIAPAAPKIKTKRLLVVADGALQYIPFAALPFQTSGEQNNQNTAQNFKTDSNQLVPLVSKYEVVSLPSAAVGAVIRQEKRGYANKQVAIYADPVFGKTDARVSKVETFDRKTVSFKTSDKNDLWSDFSRSARDVGSMSGEENNFLPRLAYTRELAASIISKMTGGKALVALDFEATRETALGTKLADYQTIIFATHGLLNSQRPELSGLVLSLVDKNGQPQNGFLRLQDVYNMHLNADLVILAACETGLGKDVRGEGLIGLTRGFMYAGAKRVLASLWKVDEEASVELIKRFYQKIELDRKTPATALREAQLEIMSQAKWQAPYYWAGFALQGDWR